MENKLSIISLDIPSVDNSPIQDYSITNSSYPPSPYISFEYPFLAKGMLFGLCLKGKARLRINLKEHVLEPNTIFTILPNQIFEPTEKSDDHFVECLFISQDFANNLSLPKDFDVLTNMTQSPCISISEEDMKELMDYHSFMLKVCSNSRRIRNEAVAKSIINAFIALLASLYAEAKVKEKEININSRGVVIVEEFSRLLMDYHVTERKASFYSDKLCISTQYLSRTLKEITGRSVNTWITDAVILEAKVLLKSSNLSILQISEKLNFSNPSFFIRYFKQYAGITPLKYREA